MRISSAGGLGHGEGRGTHKNGGSKSDTQGLFHEFSPFSGADLRKMSVDLFGFFRKVKITWKSG
jgi:hypothetical protein